MSNEIQNYENQQRHAPLAGFDSSYFTCKGCGHNLPNDFSVKSEEYCYLCDPEVTESDKSSTTMKEEFSLLRYTIELAFIKKLNECKWWQFSKRRKVYQWREQQLRKC